MAIVFLGVFGLFMTPVAKVALLTPFCGLSYAYDVMVSYAVGPVVVDPPRALACLYPIMAVVLTPLAARAFARHHVA